MYVVCVRGPTHINKDFIITKGMTAVKKLHLLVPCQVVTIKPKEERIPGST